MISYDNIEGTDTLMLIRVVVGRSIDNIILHSTFEPYSLSGRFQLSLTWFEAPNTSSQEAFLTFLRIFKLSKHNLCWQESKGL